MQCELYKDMMKLDLFIYALSDLKLSKMTLGDLGPQAPCLKKHLLLTISISDKRLRAVPEINVRGGREAPFKTYNHPS
jgi:hypothetical protein